MNNKDTILSFIIPALNEEEIIGVTIDSIIKHTPKDFVYEIIVVDNGSVDKTCDIVRSKDALLIENQNGTIAAMRNKGVSVSKGAICIFIDADVLLTNEWKVEINRIIPDLLLNPIQITGSRCIVDNKDNWIAKYWFSKLITETPNYINSGHLITTKNLFNLLGGFTEELVTAEDYDFCQKAKKKGAILKNNKSLVAIHTGYPKTIYGFMMREKWHGYQDVMDFMSFFRSKQAILALFNLILIVIAFLFFLLHKNLLYIVLYFMFIFIISSTLMIYKFRSCKLKSQFYSTIIYFFYVTGRTLALLSRIKNIILLKR